MSVKKEIAELFGTYFITITCHNWLHLFDITKSYETVYNWFDYLKKNHHFINGYVIMPNHLHALISFSNSGKKINRIVGNGKRFMAYDLVEKFLPGRVSTPRPVARQDTDDECRIKSLA
jgi:REP element-mobilizing transposase RayT